MKKDKLDDREGRRADKKEEEAKAKKKLKKKERKERKKDKKRRKCEASTEKTEKDTTIPSGPVVEEDSIAVGIEEETNPRTKKFSNDTCGGSIPPNKKKRKAPADDDPNPNHHQDGEEQAEVVEQVKHKRTKEKERRLEKETLFNQQHIQLETSLAPTTTANSNSKNGGKQQEQQQARNRHPFEADEADHCETPLRAYQDIVPLLDRIAEIQQQQQATINGNGNGNGNKQKKKRKTKNTTKNLTIYDPYYCNGGIKQKLQKLGFSNVINENRDFYNDIVNKTIPQPYDVLVTNPPYSGDHIEKLLQFVTSNKDIPFLLLLPHYVYTKPYFQKYFQSDARGTSTATTNSSSSSNESASKQQLFYLIPPNRYSYEPPSWVDSQTGSTALARGKNQTAPFPSFWYCSVPTLQQQQQQQDGNNSDEGWLTETFGKSGERRRPPSQQQSQQQQRLQYANCTADLPREFKGEFDITNKRPNPRARKRAAAAKKKQQRQQLHPQAVSNQQQQPQKGGGGGGGKRKRRRY